MSRSSSRHRRRERRRDAISNRRLPTLSSSAARDYFSLPELPPEYEVFPTQPEARIVAPIPIAIPAPTPRVGSSDLTRGYVRAQSAANRNSVRKK